MLVFAYVLFSSIYDIINEFLEIFDFEDTTESDATNQIKSNQIKSNQSIITFFTVGVT